MKIVKAAGHGIAVSGSVSINGIGEVFKLADVLAKARGFVPKSYVGQPEAIAAAILTGIELGIGPMEALRSLHVVDGRPTMAADFMLARAIRAGVRPQWLRCDAQEARIRLERDGFKPHEHSFTMEDAKAAGLAGRDNWRKYPAAMLRARCVSAALRAAHPDVLGAGVYTPEELGAPVAESGEPILVESAPADARDAAPREPSGAASCSAHEPQPEPERPKAPARVGHCKTADELRAWIAAHWPTVLRERGPEAAAVVVKHAESIGVDPSEADVWLGEATPSE